MKSWIVAGAVALLWVVPGRGAPGGVSVSVEDPAPGIGACAVCHEPEASRFREGQHGRAMAARSREMVERACVTCHGPVDAHLRDPRRGNVTRQPTEAACVACHRISREPATNAPGGMKGRVRCLECHLPGHDLVVISM